MILEFDRRLPVTSRSEVRTTNVDVSDRLVVTDDDYHTDMSDVSTNDDVVDLLSYRDHQEYLKASRRVAELAEQLDW